jgi:hypothetical protein
MTVDIADEEIFVAALDRLLIGVLQQRRRIEFFDRKVAEIGAIHGGASSWAKPLSQS